MKKRLIILIFFNISVFLLLNDCTPTQKTTEIPKPNQLYRSPALDFTKIEKCGVLPVNNYGREVPEVSEMLANSLYNELKSSQKAWSVISADDILRQINESGLARGYQNYIADLNTFETAGGATPLFTAETQNFFDELKKRYGIGALLFTWYNYDETQNVQELLGLRYQVITRILTVSTALYDITSKRVWWIAKIAVSQNESEPIQNLVTLITQSFSQNFGKGTLRQL